MSGGKIWIPGKVLLFVEMIGGVWSRSVQECYMDINGILDKGTNLTRNRSSVGRPFPNPAASPTASPINFPLIHIPVPKIIIQEITVPRC